MNSEISSQDDFPDKDIFNGKFPNDYFDNQSEKSISQTEQMREQTFVSSLELSSIESLQKVSQISVNRRKSYRLEDVMTNDLQVNNMSNDDAHIITKMYPENKSLAKLLAYKKFYQEICGQLETYQNNNWYNKFLIYGGTIFISILNSNTAKFLLEDPEGWNTPWENYKLFLLSFIVSYIAVEFIDYGISNIGKAQKMGKFAEDILYWVKAAKYNNLEHPTQTIQDQVFQDLFNLNIKKYLSPSKYIFLWLIIVIYFLVEFKITLFLIMEKDNWVPWLFSGPALSSVLNIMTGYIKAEHKFHQELTTIKNKLKHTLTEILF